MWAIDLLIRKDTSEKWGITNVLAMCEMIAAGYRITMDTDIENAFVVHCDGGNKQMRFVNRKGVYVLEQHGSTLRVASNKQVQCTANKMTPTNPILKSLIRVRDMLAWNWIRS